MPDKPKLWEHRQGRAASLVHVLRPHVWQKHTTTRQAWVNPLPLPSSPLSFLSVFLPIRLKCSHWNERCPSSCPEVCGVVGREQSWHQLYSSRYCWRNLGDSFPSLSLSFLRCKVDRGQQWAVNKVTSGKLCEGSIYTHAPLNVLCGKNGHSPANSLPSSGSAPKSRLHRTLLKTQVRFCLLFCSTSCQWLLSILRATLGWPPKLPGSLAWRCFPLLPHLSSADLPFGVSKCLLFPASTLPPAVPLPKRIFAGYPLWAIFPTCPLNRCLCLWSPLKTLGTRTLAPGLAPLLG